MEGKDGVDTRDRQPKREAEDLVAEGVDVDGGRGLFSLSVQNT